MLDQIFTPRYVITRELDKLRIGWKTGARRYKNRIKIEKARKIVKGCQYKEKQYEWKDEYRKEKEQYYNRNRWDRGN